MALRWTSAAMLEAAKGFRRLKSPQATFGTADGLAADQAKHVDDSAVEPAAQGAAIGCSQTQPVAACPTTPSGLK